MRKRSASSSFLRIILGGLVLAGPGLAAFADCQPNGTSGNDTITCSDTPIQDPDGVDGLGGDDLITLLLGATVTGGYINGDNLDNTTVSGTSPTAGKDTIDINGTMDGSVRGDAIHSGIYTGVAFAVGADDSIDVEGEVTGGVVGDLLRADPGSGSGFPSCQALASGGADTITIGGKVDQDVSGDAITSIGFLGAGVAVGGFDTITVKASGEVVGDLYGDDLDGISIAVAAGAIGGDDVIQVDGKVDGSVIGDFATSELSGFFGCGGSSTAEGGNDTITVNGVVGGNVIGDGLTETDCGTGSAGSITNGDDTIVVNGEVDGTVYGDSNDGSGTGGNDQVTIEGGATGAGPGGTLHLDGGPGTDTLRFALPFASVADAQSFAATLATKHPANDSITWNGQTYSWVNFEGLTVDAADLTISKQGPATLVAGGSGQIAYTITVTNNGPSDATNVVVTDNLPTGLTLVSTSGCAEDPSGAPTCSLGTIAANGSASYTLTAAVDPSFRGTLANSASVASDANAINPANDSATASTLVATAVQIPALSPAALALLALGLAIAGLLAVKRH